LEGGGVAGRGRGKSGWGPWVKNDLKFSWIREEKNSGIYWVPLPEDIL